METFLNKMNLNDNVSLLDIGKTIDVIDKMINENTVGRQLCHRLSKLCADKCLERSNMQYIVQWLKTICTDLNNIPTVCKAVHSIGALLLIDQKIAYENMLDIFHPKHSNIMQRWLFKCTMDNIEVTVELVMCMDNILGSIFEMELRDMQIELWQVVADNILKQYYEGVWTTLAIQNVLSMDKLSILLLHSQQLLEKFITICPIYAAEHADQLFGVAKTFMQYGIDANNLIPKLPQKIIKSQQALYDSSVMCNNSTTGGKVAKLRKPRAVIKGKPLQHIETNKMSSNSSCCSTPIKRQLETNGINNITLLWSDDMISSDLKADMENLTIATTTNVILPENIRLISINLMGTVARSLKKEDFYGYYYGLLPSDVPNNANIDILHIASIEFNPRCRSTALQVAAQLIYQAKDYLMHAECEETCRTMAFTPLSVSLGISIVAIYKKITNILNQEEEYCPVITQALKCLAAIVQATPFTKLNKGIVHMFLPRVRKLLKHHDCNIQVSALMVVGFLAAKNTWTEEIIEAMGLSVEAEKPKINYADIQNDEPNVDIDASLEYAENADDPELIKRCIDNNSQLYDKPAYSETGDEPELIKRCIDNNSQLDDKLAYSETGETGDEPELIKRCIDNNSQLDDKLAYSETEETGETEDEPELIKRCIDNNSQLNDKLTYSETKEKSWLLACLLENLLYHYVKTSTTNQRIIPTPVRVESLQVLMAISQYFTAFDMHLNDICVALQRSLKDRLPDVHLCAARCLDTMAYQMNNYIMNILESKQNGNNAKNVNILNECIQFWESILPTVYEVFLKDGDFELPTYKISLCDALSNMGANIYQRLSNAEQKRIMAFLCSISSDETMDIGVRVAAVRAQAVFVRFPSLKLNLVFIENAAEQTLLLVNVSQINVRIKAFWSLANISDALVNTHASELMLERVSNDLLRRFIDAAINASNDLDKVRTSAVRSLGNLMQLLTAEHLVMFEWRQLTLKAINKLADALNTAGNVKVKWNACYAISSLLKHRVLFDAAYKYLDFDWRTNLFTSLNEVIVLNTNYKVRIIAISAILNIETHNDFGKHLNSFWTTLLTAISQTSAENYQEYNRRDTLLEQVCYAIAHLLNCATDNDLEMFAKTVMPCKNMIHSEWTRTINRMVPEKSTPLYTAIANLEKRKCDKYLPTDFVVSLDELLNAFGNL